MRLLPRLRVALALAVCVPALAACGSSGSGGGSDDPDPAAAFPAGVGLYAEGVLRPSGSQADDLEALIEKVGKIDDPGQKIVEYLEASSKKEGTEVSYKEDIEPWLGKRFGVGVSELDRDEPSAVVVVGVTDADKAKDFVADVSKDDGSTKGSYEDTEYFEDKKEETIVGVAGDYFVFGETLPEFKAAVDQITSDKNALADSDAYDQAVSDLPDNRIGTFYLNTKVFAETLAKDPDVASGGGAAVIKQLFGPLKGVSGALTAAEDRAVLETRVVTDGDTSTLSLFGPGVAPGLVREAPADSLFVYGAKDVGATYKKTLATVAGGLGGAALQGQLSQGLGIDLDRDVFSWIGDVVVFGRGTNASSFDGAVMIDATDEDAAAAAIPRLLGVARQQGGIAFDAVELGGADQAFSTKIPGAPGDVFVARKGTRVVIALGEDAARAGLQPSATIDANGGYDRAKQATGDYDPSIIVDVQRAVGLIEQSAGSDEDFQQAKPYLEALSLLVAGSKKEGDTYVSRVALTTE